MLRLLRGDPEFVDTLMGDGITESGARVVVRLFDGDLGPILEAALDSEAEEYVRGQMLDALAMLAGSMRRSGPRSRTSSGASPPPSRRR